MRHLLSIPFTPRFVLLAVCVAGAAIACSHSKKAGFSTFSKEPPQIPPKLQNEYAIRQLIPSTLRMRRPAGPGADPKAGPGGIDYRSQPLPDAQLDCETPESLFRTIRFTELYECLAPMQDPEVVYRLKWDPVPALTLQDPEEHAACLASLLPTIPVPRELIYQSPEGDRLECYSTRLPIEKDQIARFKLPFRKTSLKLSFPLSQVPKSAEEMRLLVLTWVLTPFWDASGETLPGKLVPQSICARCVGEGNLFRPKAMGGPPPTLWPPLPALPEPTPSATP